MRFLAAERACLDRHLTGLDARLAATALAVLEAPGSPGPAMFRDAAGPGLLVPAEHGGTGVDPVSAARIQRAVGARSPSLAVATTMHHFSTASLVELAHATGAWELPEAIARRGWLMSSAFAEGRSGQHILAPTMRARRVPGGVRVSGRKKPCSLTWSMDVLSASVAVDDDAGGPARAAVVLVPADAAGIDRRRFWASWVLAGAESDEVILDDVFVPDELVYAPTAEAAADPVQGRGFLWFELLVTATYLGVSSGLVERVLDAGRGDAVERSRLGGELESAMAAVESVAAAIPTASDEHVPDLLARALHVRYAAEDAVARVSWAAAGLLGGMAFVESSDTAYLLAAGRALAFHPPSRRSASTALDDHLRGEALTL